MAMAVRRAAGVDWDAYRGPRTTKRGATVSNLCVPRPTEATQPPPRLGEQSQQCGKKPTRVKGFLNLAEGQHEPRRGELRGRTAAEAEPKAAEKTRWS